MSQQRMPLLLQNAVNAMVRKAAWTSIKPFQRDKNLKLSLETYLARYLPADSAIRFWSLPVPVKKHNATFIQQTTADVPQDVAC